MYKDITNLLNANRLKEALAQLQAYASQTSDWKLKNDIEALQTSYDLMLQYTIKGMQDPNKAKLYNDMKLKAYTLADRTHIFIEAKNVSNAYYDHYRTAAELPYHSFAELQLMLESYTESKDTIPLLYPDPEVRKKKTEAARRKYMEAIDELFYKIWVTPQWNDTDAEEADELLYSPLVKRKAQAVMVSAVTMSLLANFDLLKFNFLIDAYSHDSNMISMRALVGMALAFYYYDDRIRLYPDTKEILEGFYEDSTLARELYDVQIQLLKSVYETQKVEKIMRDEIIPEISNNPILKSSRLGIEEHFDPEEGNPEWEKWMDDSKLNEKLQELGEMQLGGADVYMGTFSQLKQFPFFKETPHWFYPFDSALACVNAWSSPSMSPLINMLTITPIFCNSDKYSFCLTINEMPIQQKQLLESQLVNRLEWNEFEEQIRQRLGTRNMQRENISRLYIQDLYRYFKLWKAPRAARDIFLDKLDLWNTPSLAPILQSSEYAVKLADYLSGHDCREEALPLYRKATEHTPQHAELYQKMGYIYQQKGDYEQAIANYRQADVLAPDNVWNNRHLAQCYRKTGHNEEALTYYKKVEQVQPDNLTLTLQIGQCLMALERYDEALAYFFKLEYLDKNPQNARRGIGWCHFITGKWQEAKKYYDMLTAEPKPIKEDWMNAGHIYYISGDVARAVEYYSKAQELCGSHNKFIELFRMDEPELLKQGITQTDLYVLLDALV